VRIPSFPFGGAMLAGRRIGHPPIYKVWSDL